jgi:soluble lytic murein transglycosylase
MGRALFRAGRYADAERHLLAMHEQASAPRIAADALYLAGRSQYRQGQVTKGRATFLRTVERFPKEKAAAEALYTLADLDHDDGKLDVARQGYRRVATLQPGANEAGLALMRLGGLAYLNGDFKGALTIFDEYRSAHPEGRRVQQATYWAARTQQRLGNRSEATTRLREVRRIDPFSWYGIRAAELLGENLWDVPIRPEPLANAKVEGEVAHAFERLDLLSELGERSAASFEVDRLKRHFQATDGASYALAEAFNARGFTSTGIRMGWEIYRREGAWNPRLLRIIYPFPYRELITAEARSHNLDPFFVAALIRQESMFNATVKSPVGAVGLMQVMPATGKILARGAGIANFATDHLEHPEINLHLGTAYLAELMGRYKQRVTSVLAAYNAGPNRVSRWSAFPEYQDEELFAERIPFTETRDYVKIVQQNARLYAALYAGPAAPIRTGN